MGIVQQALAARRPLPIALAHWVMAIRPKPGSRLTESHSRLYAAMSHADRLAYLAELHECRAAKRGERLAHVSS